jgi:hypothetical protein
MSEAMEVGLLAAGAAIVGGILSGVYQHLLDSIRRPVLEFEFQNCSAQETESPYIRHASWNEENEERSWLVVRASVRNSGRSTAKGVRIYLIDLHEIHDGKKRQAGFYDSAPLPWAGWDFNSRDIPPK